MYQFLCLCIGAGKVTDTLKNTVIACFVGEGGSHNLSCVIKNEGIQTDTVWTVRNYNGVTGPLKITNDEIFQISGDRRPTASESELNYGNYLSISDCSVRKLNEVTVHCGSYTNPNQTLIEFIVCGKPIKAWSSTKVIGFNCCIITQNNRKIK